MAWFMPPDVCVRYPGILATTQWNRAQLSRDALNTSLRKLWRT